MFGEGCFIEKFEDWLNYHDINIENKNDIKFGWHVGGSWIRYSIFTYVSIK